MRLSIAVCILWMPFIVLAESTLPKGCHPVAVQGESVTLKTKQNKMFFIHNLTKTDLWITHPVVDPGASAGWSSRLQVGNWSALVINQGTFVINCIESKPGHEQQIPCEGAIAVCQWEKIKFPSNSDGAYWAGEDMSISALNAALGSRGFVLPSSQKQD